MAKPHSAFVEELLDLLRPFGDVSAKRMFGAYGIYRDGTIFGLVDDEVVYFKADDGNRAEFEAAGQGPFLITLKDGRTESMSYYTLPDGALDSPARLRPWAQLGWEAAQRAAEKKAKRSSRPRGSSPGKKK